MAYRASDEARDFAIGEYQIGRLTGKATINFGAPITGPAGEVHAVVFAALDLGWLAQRVGEQQIVPGSRVTVFDKKGTVENLVKWVKSNFLPGRSVADDQDLAK